MNPKDQRPPTSHRIFVNGKMINDCTEGYDIAFQRALGVAIYLNISDSFENPKSPDLIDKWVKDGKLILVARDSYVEPNKSLSCK